MALEIERKFLVRDESWRSGVTGTHFFRQGYLATTARASIRVRVSGDAAWLGLKGRVVGLSRPEFEYPVPVAEANEILDGLCGEGAIEKYRHYVPHAGHEWEVDEFLGANAGLVVAELELASEDEAFERPAWLGIEVTHDLRYYNSSLARQPWLQWPAASDQPGHGSRA
jgi:adenylate cyclase